MMIFLILLVMITANSVLVGRTFTDILASRNTTWSRILTYAFHTFHTDTDPIS